MNILVGAIVGVLAALTLPSLLRLMKIKEETAKKINPILIVIIVLVGIKVYGVYEAQNIKKDKATLNAAVEDFEKVAKGDTSVTTTKIVGDVDANNTARAAYALAELTKTAKPYIERMNATSKKAAALVSDDLLGDKIYTDKNALNATRNFIENYPKLVEEDLAIYDELVAKQSKTLDSLKIDKEFIKGMREGFDKSVRERRELRIVRMKASKKFVDKVKVVVQLAERNFGKVKITSEGLDFLNDADNALYNKNFEELQQAANEEEKAANAIAESQKKSIDKLKSNIK